MQPELLTPKEATNYLYRKFNVRYSHRYFAKMRSVTTDGPPFENLGPRIYYRPDELDRWITERLQSYRTTAERTIAASRAKQARKGKAAKRAIARPAQPPVHDRDLDIFELLAGRPG
jgi:hypothetical protein